MNNSKSIKQLYLTCAAIAFTLGMSQATASPFYTFTFAGAQVTGGGSFSTIVNADGSLTAVSGSEYDTIGGITEHLTLITDPAAPTGIAYSPADAFWYDDKLIPTASQVLTLGGLMFVGSDGREINIWSTGTSTYIFDRWQAGSYGLGEQKITFSAIDPPTPDVDAVVIPEPATLALLGLGLLGCVSARRKEKKATGR